MFVVFIQILFNILKFEDPGEDEEDGVSKKSKGLTEIDHARRDCKARSVLNKFKAMEQRVLNGEEEEEGM